MEKQKLEKWCSDECGRRALFIRVQLNKEPAWTFAGSAAPDIQLYGEHTCSLQPLASKEGQDLSEAHNKLEQLALERGEKTVKHIGQGMSNMSIHEPNQDRTANSFSIEGYVTKLPHKGQLHLQTLDHEGDEDIMDMI